MIPAHFQLLQFMLEVVRVHAQINHRADKHVAADTAEDVEIKSFHFLTTKKHTRLKKILFLCLLCLFCGNSFFYQCIDLACRVSSPKTIINVHDGNAAAATIQHPEQRRNAPETCAVTDTRRHGNDRLRNQPSHHARQRTFHSCNDDDDVRALDS